MFLPRLPSLRKHWRASRTTSLQPRVQTRHAFTQERAEAKSLAVALTLGAQPNMAIIGIDVGILDVAAGIAVAGVEFGRGRKSDDRVPNRKYAGRRQRIVVRQFDVVVGAPLEGQPFVSRNAAVQRLLGAVFGRAFERDIRSSVYIEQRPGAAWQGQ